MFTSEGAIGQLLAILKETIEGPGEGGSFFLDPNTGLLQTLGTLSLEQAFASLHTVTRALPRTSNTRAFTCTPSALGRVATIHAAIGPRVSCFQVTMPQPGPRCSRN